MKTVFVFAGCGGTFWTATPQLAALTKKYKPDLVLYIDPDRLEGHNLERQWVLATEGQEKAEAAMLACSDSRAMYFPETFPPSMRSGINDEIEDGDRVIVVTNVDSNPARVKIRDWCLNRRGWTAQIVSGCDLTYGQVYYGIYVDRHPLVDWIENHPDVVEPTEPGPACGQNISSNAMTGVFLGWALQEVMLHAEDPGYAPVQEYYWKVDGEGRVRVWTELVQKTGEVLV